MSAEPNVVELTIAEIHEAMRAGELTSEALVRRYLDRIEAYDREGPELNSIITVNDAAIERAATLDRRFETEGPVGPLHGVPILVKDQVMTAGLRTTFGSAAFAEFVPESDATIVTRLLEAGAVILAKTNLPDWAAGLRGFSSVLGQTKNPYALERDSGGSSAGTGVGVAANLGTVGIGEDTGGSIRVPASCCNLFGIRVTTGLVSRTGLSPLVERQDTAGPMARTVTDMARVLDVLTGYDPTDDRTGATVIAGDDRSYVDHVDPDGLERARLGVVRQAFGDDAAAAPVNGVVEAAMSAMRDAGATLIDPVAIPDLEARLSETALYTLQAKHDINGFLAKLPEPPVDSVTALYEAGTYHERQELFEWIAEGPDEPGEAPDYWRKVAAQDELQRVLTGLHAKHDLDALVLPDVQVLPQRRAAIHSGAVSREEYVVNTFIASQAGCPAISVPGGVTDEGVPVGVELVGPPYAEPRLIELAAGYERHADPRVSPATAGPLS